MREKSKPKVDAKGDGRGSRLFKILARFRSSIYWRSRNLLRTVFGLKFDGRGKIYQRWQLNFEKENFTALKFAPKISIMVPVYNIDPKLLKKCVDSVGAQSYENWELCLYDDASTNPRTINFLKNNSTLYDKRIKIKFGDKNKHISEASNEALKMATGEYVGLLDNDDTLAPNALFEVAKALNENPKLKFIYSDEDKITKQGKRFDPFFKPDWSPELLLSMMYTSHLSVYKKTEIERVSGFRRGYEGSQDYDLVLRITEGLSPDEVYHIPKVLYHWRALKNSTATGQNIKDYTTNSAIESLRDYVKRNKIKATIEPGIAPGSYRIKRDILGSPKVSVIIPFRDQAEKLKTAVNSIIEKTTYQNYDIILVDNQSQKKSTLNYLNSVVGEKRVHILSYNKPFNFSAINNFAVKNTDCDFVVLLNNDTEVISPEWLTSMLSEAQRPEIGAVGAKLLFPNNTVQHAGVIMGLGIAGHANKYLKDSDYGYFRSAISIKNYLAVTGACMMVSKKKYLEAGGLDEKNLPVAYNDVDFCLKLYEAGYRNLFTPYAKLYHHESISRGDDNEVSLARKDSAKYKRVISERKYMENRWEKYIKHDPYFSPNLSKKYEDFRIKTEDEV